MNFCISEHFFKNLGKNGLCIVSYLFLKRSIGRNSGKSVCLHLANEILIIELLQRVLEADADLKGRAETSSRGETPQCQDGVTHLSAEGWDAEKP